MNIFVIHQDFINEIEDLYKEYGKCGNFTQIGMVRNVQVKREMKHEKFFYFYDKRFNIKYRT